MRWPAALALSCAFCTFHIPCRAETPAALRDVPVSDPAYSRVQALEPYAFTGYPDGTFSGKRALTRFEFAVALQRMCQETERLLASYPPTERPWLRFGPASRPDSPWKPVAVVPADDHLRELSLLVQEFTPELKMMGQDVERETHSVDECLKRGLALRPRGGPVTIWDAVQRMEELPSPRARAEAALKLLREEIAHPSPDSGYVAGLEVRLDHLRAIIDGAADSRAEAGTLLDAWRNSDKGRLHDCLTVLLGRMGVAHVRDELRVCAADAEMPPLLRVTAVEALRNAATAADIHLLVQLAQSDGAAYRGLKVANCVEQGPQGWCYPVRRAARDVLARLTPADASTRALVQRTVKCAVVFEKLGIATR